MNKGACFTCFESEKIDCDFINFEQRFKTSCMCERCFRESGQGNKGGSWAFVRKSEFEQKIRDFVFSCEGCGPSSGVLAIIHGWAKGNASVGVSLVTAGAHKVPDPFDVPYSEGFLVNSAPVVKKHVEEFIKLQKKKVSDKSRSKDIINKASRKLEAIIADHDKTGLIAFTVEGHHFGEEFFTVSLEASVKDLTFRLGASRKRMFIESSDLDAALNKFVANFVKNFSVPPPKLTNEIILSTLNKMIDKTNLRRIVEALDICVKGDSPFIVSLRARGHSNVFDSHEDLGWYKITVIAGSSPLEESLRCLLNDFFSIVTGQFGLDKPGN